MSANTKLVSDIEALLAQAKSYNADQPDPLTQLDLLGKVEALHYQLDTPALAMYRQLTNVRGHKSSFCSIHAHEGVSSPRLLLSNRFYKWVL